MADPRTLENLAADVALLRQELQAVLATHIRLDDAVVALEQRLIAIRDENQDIASGLRDVRREVLAHNRAIRPPARPPRPGRPPLRPELTG